MKRYVEAADVANQMNDIDLVEKCYNIAQRNDPQAANQISARFS